MSEEVLINITPQETRVAVVENGMLQEVHVERTHSRGMVGNIYKGKVVRVLPGMQAAFVDVGLERTAFLHAVDVLLTPGRLPAERYSTGNGNGNDTPSISGLLYEGQEVVVQIVKDPLGTKGARLTMQITIPARYLVFLPYSDHIGVSQKITDSEERERLRDVVRGLCGDAPEDSSFQSGGYIVRTVAESASDEELRADIQFLTKIWRRLEGRIRDSKPHTLLYEDIPLAMRTMRDLVKDKVEKLRIDSRETYQKAKTFAQDLIPEVVNQIEYYPGERPIFDLYSVEDEIQRALDKNVPLKSGGYLVIDQTEAMTTIDVNTGGFVGRRNLGETLFKTNLEATQAIARQLRLRNIGGIIIIDFIDMESEQHCRQVMRALEKALTRDSTKTFITEMSPLGLVEITRKRTQESLERLLTETCPVCKGNGVLKTAQTICYEIFREILRETRQYEAGGYMVLASQLVIDMLLDEESSSLADLQEFIGKPIQLQVEVMYQQEDYDVVLL